MAITAKDVRYQLSIAKRRQDSQHSIMFTASGIIDNLFVVAKATSYHWFCSDTFLLF